MASGRQDSAGTRRSEPLRRVGFSDQYARAREGVFTKLVPGENFGSRKKGQTSIISAPICEGKRYRPDQRD